MVGSGLFDKSMGVGDCVIAEGLRDQHYILRKKGQAISFGGRVGEFFKQEPKVLVRVEPACLCGLDQAIECCCRIGSGRAPCEQPVFAAQREGPDRVFDGIVVRCYISVLQIADEFGPSVKA
jgi:hypothetical protein